MTLLLIGFTYHDIFDLRSLLGIFIIFAGPLLVDNFGGRSLDWASLGHEAHGLDTMARTMGDDDNLWRLERHHGGSHLAPTSPTFCLWRSKRHLGRLDVTPDHPGQAMLL
jgi:hypothetical protein